MRFLAVWFLWGVGDLLSRISYDPIGGLLYRPYNWCMIASSELQGERRGKYWPWHDVTDSNGDQPGGEAP